MGPAHTRDINRMDDEHDPRFADYAGEVDVPVRAGDLVVGDARMFHATHANTTGEYRTVITIWFHPLFEDLQEPTQSWIHYAFHHQHAGVAGRGARQDRSADPGLSGLGRAARLQPPARPDQVGAGIETGGTAGALRRTAERGRAVHGRAGLTLEVYSTMVSSCLRKAREAEWQQGRIPGDSCCGYRRSFMELSRPRPRGPVSR